MEEIFPSAVIRIPFSSARRAFSQQMASAISFPREISPAFLNKRVFRSPGKQKVPALLLWQGVPGYRTDGSSYHGGVCGQLPDLSAGPGNSGALPEGSIRFPGLLFIVSFLVPLKDQKQDREIQKKGADPSCEKESYPFFSGGKKILKERSMITRIRRKIPEIFNSHRSQRLNERWPPLSFSFDASSFLQNRRAAKEPRRKYPSEDTRQTQILYRSIRQGEDPGQ